MIPPAPCRGSVIRVTPSSPKRLYLPLRANLHRQVWGLDSVPAPLTAKPHQLFGAAGGCRGGTPCKPFAHHHPAAAVLPVQWQDANGGLMFSSASRWRRSRRTGQNGGCQVAPIGGRVEIFAPGENTTRYLTDGKPERTGERQTSGNGKGRV